MPDVDEATEVAALPSDDGVEPGIEGDGDPPNRAEWYRIEPAMLDATDGRPRDARSGGEIVLAQPFPNSNRAQRCAQPMVVHERESAESRLSAAHLRGGADPGTDGRWLRFAIRPCGAP
jgi:hypothetical protein